MPQRFVPGVRLEYWILTGIFFAGLILGTLGTRENDGVTFLNLFAKRLVQLRVGAGFLTAAGSTFFSVFAFLAAALLFGSSAFGLPLLLLLPLARGIGVGCVSAWLLQRAGMQGAIVELTLFLLPDCAAALLVICYCAFCARTSMRMFSFHIAGKSGTGIRADALFRLFLLSVLAAFLTSLLAGTLSVVPGPDLAASGVWAAAL